MNITGALAELRIPPLAELTRVVDAAHGMIHGVVVNSAAEKQFMVDELRSAKDKLDRLNETRLGITRPMDQAKAGVMDLFRGPCERLTALIEEGKRACIAFDKRERDAAEARQRELEAQAEAERKRLRDEAAAMPMASAEDAVAVADKLTQAELTVAPVVRMAPAKVSGAHGRRVWMANVKDHQRAVAALMANPAFRQCVVIDGPALRKIAQLTRGSVEIDGIEFYEDEGMALR